MPFRAILKAPTLVGDSYLLLYICISSQMLPEKADWGEIGE